jgi:hypothetical protein
MMRELNLKPVEHAARRVPGPCSYSRFEEGPPVKKLTVADIKDTRAYERERDEFRRQIIDMKRNRRVPIGPIMTLVFENTDTMRWQVQEMARAERMTRDEQIEHELDTYNQLIPHENELSATLLIELTSEPALRDWLPRLAGIEHSIALALPDGSDVPGRLSEEDEARLTRDDTTAAVHFLKFRLTPAQAAAFEKGPVRIVVHHLEYEQDVTLTPEQHAAIAMDLG